MKGKIFTEIQFSLVVRNKKHSFWEVCKTDSSKYETGEVLYLKEPYRIQKDAVSYKYDSTVSGIEKWENKLFMPERIARYFIRITGGRTGMLNTITCLDCLESGLPPEKCHKNTIGKKAGNVPVWIYDFEIVNENEK